MVNLVSKNCLIAIANFISCWVLTATMQQNAGIKLHRERRGANNTSNLGTSRLNIVGTGNGTGNSLRGRGSQTGSGSSTGNGNLPPCHLCFGHGVNPSIDPRCKFGCRGGGQPTGAGSITSLLPTTMVRLAFANMGSDQRSNCTGKDNCSRTSSSRMIASRGDRKTERESKVKGGAHQGQMLWVGLGGLCALCLSALGILIYRKNGCKKRQTRVGVVATCEENKRQGSENI